MPRRSTLSAAERESLLALPDTKDELIRHYTFSESDLSIIRQRRGPANRLGFTVQLCYLRFPGVILGVDEPPFPPLLRLVADRLKVGVESWDEYGQREQIRRELQTVFGFQPFTMSQYRQAVQLLTELAMQTDKGIVLASALIEQLRRQSVILPALNAIERASAEAITHANRRIYDALAEPLSDAHLRRLDDLLKHRDNGKTTWLAWLRQSPAKPNSRHMLEHIERLKAWQALDLPAGIERLVHQNRLLKIAREGGQMTPADLAKFEPQRRYATMVALAIEGMATVTDEIIDLHDRILGKLFNAAKNKHQQQFQASGKAINAKVRLFGRIGQALIEAKQSGGDPFAAIESVLSWDAFAESVSEAQKLAQPEDFDFLHRIGESYATLRRYAPEFLDVLKLRAAPAAKNVLDAIITESGLKITPLNAAVPDTAQALIDQTAMILPHVKITELLLEVDEWTCWTPPIPAATCTATKGTSMADARLALSPRGGGCTSSARPRRASPCPPARSAVTPRIARVEPVFAALEQRGGKLLRCLGLERATFQLTGKAATYNLRRLGSMKTCGVAAF